MSTYTIKDYLEKYENVSLRKLSIETGCTYGLVLKQARKPVQGQLYDPNSINYEALDAYFEKREVDLSTLNWDELNKVTSRIGEASISKNMEDYQVGTTWWLREDNENPFEIVYKTDTHIVVLKQGDTEPHSMKHSTFLAKGPMKQSREE